MNVMLNIMMLILVPLAIAFTIFIGLAAFQKNKMRLERLLPIIDGQISTTFRSGYFLPILKGTWNNEKVVVEFVQNQGFVNLFITLDVHRTWPCSITIIPLEQISFPYRSMKAFISGCKFELPEENIKVISDIDDEPGIRSFLHRGKLRIIEDLFSHGFDYLYFCQNSESGGYVTVGLKNFFPGFKLWFLKAQCDSVMNPETINYILTKLKEL